MLSFSAYLAEQYASRDQALKAAKQSFPDKKQYRWNPMPNIGWWADKNAVIFYHGTHFTNLEPMLAAGIKAPNHGPTAGWVSMALEPNTAHGYASMGGESGFRAAGAQARAVPPNERVVLVARIPLQYVQKYMEKEFRGNITYTRNRLVNPAEYAAWKKSDQEYYAMTEIRFPKVVDPRFIIGYMVKP